MFTLREMTLGDGDAFADLARSSPDTGQVQLYVDFHINAYASYKATKHDMMGVVATHPQHDGIVGAGVVSFFDTQFNGVPKKGALLSALMVHPDVRRQGLATQLAGWRVEQARKHIGEDGVIFAAIQKGNAGSITNARKWANQTLDNFVIVPVKTRTSPPQPISGYTVRMAEPTDYEQIAEHTNTFYTNYNMHLPLRAHTMEAINQDLPINVPLYHWMVVEDQTKSLVAGIMIIDTPLLYTAKVVKIPTAIKIANLFLRVIPANGEIKMLSTKDIWYRDGHESAAAYLWQCVRYEWRNRGSAVLINHDLRSPIKKLLKNSFIQPKSGGSYAVYCKDPIDKTRLLNPYS